MAMVPIMAPSSLWRGNFLGGAGSRLRIIRIAIEEWLRFGGQVAVGTRRPGRLQVVHHGSKEQDADTVGIVGQYWQNIGLNYDGNDTEQYWSAAFISYVMAQAGVPEADFPRSRRHMTWIHHAIRNKLDRVAGAKLIGHQVTDHAPREGDLVCYTRSGWLDYAAAARQARGASHSDIVVYAWGSEIGVIGGNVRDSVTLKRLPVDGDGLIADRSTGHDWFCVIENRMRWS